MRSRRDTLRFVRLWSDHPSFIDIARWLISRGISEAPSRLHHALPARRSLAADSAVALSALWCMVTREYGEERWHDPAIRFEY